MLCDDPNERKSEKEEIRGHVQLIHFVVQQK